jgi:uncharacterized protein (TIGR00296 family)
MGVGELSIKKPVHPDELSFEEGEYLVRIARKAVEEKLFRGITIKPPDDLPEIFRRPGMTFTTIETYHPSGRTTLRGCIGFLAPIYSLIESTIKSAIEAAFNDPRFPPLSRDEIDSVVFEVTVLSEPRELVVRDKWLLPKMITIGRHGLVVEKGWFKGTLLPVVPIEYCWDEETFLAETCIKAGLQPDCWLEEDTKIYVYDGRAFKEKTPRGEIYERDLNREYKELCKRG